jgi:hypothetical protein
MSSEPIHKILEELPSSNLTTRLLGALDYIVPGSWENVTSWETMVKRVTGEEDQELIQRVGDRAIQLYNDPEQGYQRAVQIFNLVDSTQGLAGAAEMANKLSEAFDFLSFLGKITPKADTTQGIDAAVKFVAEMATFCYCNGLPGDSVGDFATALTAYEKEDSMRFAAWVTFDLVLPLGPDFLSKTLDVLSSATSEQLGENSRFGKIARYLPGSDFAEKQQMLTANLALSSAHITTFVAEKGIDQQDIFQRIKSYVEVGDNALDYVSAAIDLGTNYFQHTGIQSVSRRLISRAYGEI